MERAPLLFCREVVCLRLVPRKAPPPCSGREAVASPQPSVIQGRTYVHEFCDNSFLLFADCD
eukprot:scaffold134857_cov33-Tisochrysis_lutea.AAC.1